VDVKKIWHWLLDADWKTWLGHGIIGFAITAIAGWQFTLGAFVYREVSDLITWYFADSEWGKPAFQDKLRDCFFDLWSPMAGAALAMILFG
jgi:hypothetical protein